MCINDREFAITKITLLWRGLKFKTVHGPPISTSYVLFRFLYTLSEHVN